MEKQVQQYISDFMSRIEAKNPNEPEFHQAVHEVVESLAPYIIENPVLMKMKVLERIAEPERVIISACRGSMTKAKWKSTAVSACR